MAIYYMYGDGDNSAPNMERAMSAYIADETCIRTMR